tara:strand:- start:32 stop:151 length:120 start_codon:yes stop_codon:yes gene_type:complete
MINRYPQPEPTPTRGELFVRHVVYACAIAVGWYLIYSGA